MLSFCLYKMQDWLRDEELRHLWKLSLYNGKPGETLWKEISARGVGRPGGGGRTRLKQLCGNPFQKLCHLAMQRMKFHLSLSERYCLNTLYFGSETKIRLPVGLLVKFTRMIELSAPAGYGVKWQHSHTMKRAFCTNAKVTEGQSNKLFGKINQIYLYNRTLA